jgi:hypothetical protein
MESMQACRTILATRNNRNKTNTSVAAPYFEVIFYTKMRTCDHSADKSHYQYYICQKSFFVFL